MKFSKLKNSRVEKSVKRIIRKLKVSTKKKFKEVIMEDTYTGIPDEKYVFEFIPQKDGLVQLRVISCDYDEQKIVDSINEDEDVLKVEVVSKNDTGIIIDLKYAVTSTSRD